MTAVTAPPRWLQAHADRTGDDDALIGTRAVPRHCRACGLLLLAGYDAPLIAGLAVVDPYRLTSQMEAAAVLLGRPTWRLWGAPGRLELTGRFYPGVLPLGRHPPAEEVVVVAAHRCGTPPLSSVPLPVRAPRVVAAGDDDEDPPF